MEYVEGESLADTLQRRGKLPAGEAVELVLQTCEGLEHAHAHGLVHRDIKPGNLLLRDDGLLKIADFGIARAAEATKLTQVGTVLGTAAYLSPEQAAGSDVTPAADLYSLGVVLYELLTGRTPYVVDSLPQLAVQQREGAITPLGALEPVTATLEGAVTRCLAYDPAARPGSAAELARELRQPEAPTELLETRVVPTQPGTGIHWHRSWSWTALTAALVLTALIVALLATDSRRPRNNPVPVEPVSRGSTPADEARNLSDWLLRHSG
jgi:serine/threonine protein kinase